MTPVVDSLWVSVTETRLSGISNNVDTLQYKLDALQAKTEMLSGIIEASNDSISNQLSAASYLLAIIAIIITLASVVLGIYLGNKKKEIEVIGQTVEERKKAVEEMAAVTKRLNEQIHGNLKNLYSDLRKEETNTLLDRLILEPKDVSNLLTLLLARDLEEDGFGKLREAYLQLINPQSGASVENDDDETEKQDEYSSESDSYQIDYILLFFQHYLYDAIKDPIISPELIRSFPQMFVSAFKRDIIKSTIDLCRALSEENSVFNKEDVLVAYLKALNQSEYKNVVELKNILEQNIMPKLLLKSAIDRCSKDEVYLVLFGITKPVLPKEDVENKPKTPQA